MIRLTIFIISLCLGIITKAQPSGFELKNFRTEQINTQQNGMKVLGSWAAFNIITGAYYKTKTTGSTKYFHQMNMYWGIVNGALAGITLLRLPAAKKKALNFTETMKDQQKVEKIFLFNAGLDVAYMAAGIALKESSKSNSLKRDKRFGFGNSLLLQGGFLLLFDGVMYSILHKKGSVLYNVMEKINLSVETSNLKVTVML